MADGNFIKKNLVLIMGLALPVALMAFFFIASSLPQNMSDPPQHDMVFSAQYFPGSTAIPVSMNLIVKDGVLKVQYVKMNAPSGYGDWRKLYIYEAKTQKVRELPFGFPPDMDKITGTREDVVEATKDMKLDTALQSSDGYELSYDGYSHSGLVNEIFWSGRYSNEPRLRKGGSSVRLTSPDNQTSFYYGGIQFIGWVK
jgi:hypothetical protein